MDTDGEYLASDERVVVSPAAGVFTPAGDLPHAVTPGATLGHVRFGRTEVPVVSAFAGRLMSLDAVAGQRVGEYERIGWLRPVAA